MSGTTVLVVSRCILGLGAILTNFQTTPLLDLLQTLFDTDLSLSTTVF
jgi:hypothetical protein